MIRDDDVLKQDSKLSEAKNLNEKLKGLLLASVYNSRQKSISDAIKTKFKKAFYVNSLNLRPLSLNKNKIV